MTIRAATGKVATVIRHLVVATALAGTAGGMARSGNALEHGEETAARNQAIVRGAFDAWAAGNGNVFDLLSPGIHWTIHGSGAHEMGSPTRRASTAHGTV